MLPASTTENGISQAMPDTCNTPAPPAPPVPIPYPNIAQLNQANVGTSSQKVKVNNKHTITLNTEIPVTSGDEAGSAGGLVSGMIKGPAKPKKGSQKVTIEGQAWVTMTAMFQHNGTNANAPAGTQIAPSQTKVLING